MIKVIAKKLGFYRNSRRRKDSRFEVRPEDFSPNWMLKVEDIDAHIAKIEEESFKNKKELQPGQVLPDSVFDQSPYTEEKPTVETKG